MGQGSRAVAPREKGRPHAASLSTFLEDVFDNWHPSP
jgi:hypothetical protein